MECNLCNCIGAFLVLLLLIGVIALYRKITGESFQMVQSISLPYPEQQRARPYIINPPPKGKNDPLLNYVALGNAIPERDVPIGLPRDLIVYRNIHTNKYVLGTSVFNIIGKIKPIATASKVRMGDHVYASELHFNGQKHTYFLYRNELNADTRGIPVFKLQRFRKFI